MNSTCRIWTEKNIFIAILMVAGLIFLYLAPQSAANVDEQLHYPHAKKVVNWYFTGGEDQSCLHTPHTNLKYYGQSVDNLTALINRVLYVEDEYLTRHYTGALFFWLILLLSGILSHRLTGSWLTATFTVLVLVFMPRLSGQAFGNLKDIPFAAGYMAGLLGIVHFLKEIPHVHWKTTILTGFIFAFTISVRAGGYILLAYLGLGLVVYLLINPFIFKQIISSGKLKINLLLHGITLVLISWIAGLLFWPYALQNILIHPLEGLRMMQHYQVSIRQVFEGRLIWSTDLPGYYLTKWIFISTPLLVLSGFFLYIGNFFRELIKNRPVPRQFFYEGFILFATLFPFFYVTAIGSNLYSGVRQMLFIFPPMAILAVTAIFKCMEVLKRRHKKLTGGIIVLLAILLIWPVKHQISTFPVDYVYFNILAGGNKNAWGNYEYDYYFHGVKEPADHLKTLIGNEEITVAMNSNLSNYFDQSSNIDYVYTRFHERSSYDWDYGIFGLNYIHPYLLKNNLWQPEGIIKTFYQKGNPVAILLKRVDKSDFYGISEIKIGNLHQGIQLLKKAAQHDPNNVWLLVNLAKAKLETGDIPGFEHDIEAGKKIHPYYEPVLLLEATRYYKEGKYNAAIQKLNELLEINPRYMPAKELLETVMTDQKKIGRAMNE
ncbi:MAG: tetratricopeptide repeat protein [Mariniphaga sp.]